MGGNYESRKKGNHSGFSAIEKGTPDVASELSGLPTAIQDWGRGDSGAYRSWRRSVSTGTLPGRSVLRGGFDPGSLGVRNGSPVMSDEAAEILAGQLTILRKHLESHKCTSCMQHYNSVMRAISILSESQGLPHPFPNTGTPIEEMDGTKTAKVSPYDCTRCHVIIGEIETKVWDVGGWRHEKCPPEKDSYQRQKELDTGGRDSTQGRKRLKELYDTPETAAAKVKQAMDVGKLALKIFGRK
jgi:hypothetical protein